MLTVSNTSPISNLASIGRLELLNSQFSEVRIPDAVMQELDAHPDPAAQSAIQDAIQNRWLLVDSAKDSGLLRVLRLQVHPGEAEAIALAMDLRADVVLIDEQEARHLAAQVGLAVTGVLGILLRAKRTGELAAVKPELDLLRSKARFFISPSLEMKIPAAAGE